MRIVTEIALLLSVFLVFTYDCVAQQSREAFISGKVIDENDQPIRGVTVTILGRQHAAITSDSGTFSMRVPAARPFAVVLTHSGYRALQKNFFLSGGEREVQVFRLYQSEKVLQDVIIRDGRERRETGLVDISPEDALATPAAIGGVESLIKILVGSNNELTSQYSVRGGNYDENLIYINDFEIYRPYLIRSGQQEGLSFINPELVKNIRFYNGGFPVRYGDKISSALDIQYKTPVKNRGSAYVSLLEQGLHFEGISDNKKFSWLVGARTRSNQSLLSSQETKGDYIPSAADLQISLHRKLNKSLSLEGLGIISVSRFHFIPESAQKSTAIFSPLYTMNLGLDIQFEGQEKDHYTSNLFGLTLHHTVHKNLEMKWLFNRYEDQEQENFDIQGAYLFGERSFDKSSTDFGEITNPLGAGIYQNYARNRLNIQVYSIEQRGSYRTSGHFIQWGAGGKSEHIRDHLSEWEMQDSAGYSIPYSPVSPRLKNVIKADNDLQVARITGFVQDNVKIRSARHDLFLQLGLRMNYNDLNHELLISPRGQFSLKPDWNRDVVFKASVGIYDQPPFYRELRRPDGSIHKDLKSQKSSQYVLGADYNTRFGSRPLRITSEIYYKNMKDVVSYDIDNVRIIYSGENDARAFAAGVETRIYTELVQDAESWFSLNIGRTMENLNDDHYYIYTNAAGEMITPESTDRAPADSIQRDVGWIRRPSDRLVTLGLFLQDYLSTNKNFRVHLNMIYGSNMTYNIPDNPRYRNGLIIEPYFRADIGFSAILLGEKTLRRSHSPFRTFENIWASVEIFNLIDRRNVISYQLIKDFADNTFSIPNRLTPRLVNLKLLARF